MQFKKIISLVIVAATLFSLVSASLPVTAITADEMQYVRFSAMRHRNLSVTYSVNGKTGTFEDSWGYLGFIGRAVDQSGDVFDSHGAYSFGICTEGEKIGSGGPENSTMRDGEVQSGASEAYVYVPSKQIFDFTYTDENKSLPADWVFKCFYYANQIALERGIDIAELEKGYWETDAELRELKKYNENKKNGTLSDKDILIDLSYCVQIAAKMIPDFMFETDENGTPVKFNYDLQIISATSDRGHRFKSEYRENDADVRDVMENCAEIIKRAIEDKDGISDKLFRIDEKGAWAVTNPDGQTVSRLTFYHTFNPSYRGTYQRMGVFTTDYHTTDSPENRGTIEIYKTDTNGNPLQGAEFTISNIANPTVKEIITTDSNGYAATEREALDFGIYTIVETKFPDGYSKADGAPTSWRVTLSADTPNGVVTVNAVNDTKKTSVSGVKTWADNENQDGIRPDSITVRLYADGVEIASKTVTENDGWAYTFEDLPVMEAGKRIEYTVLEDSVPGYTPTVNGFDITNTHTPEVITVSGVKTWDDDNDRDGVRPDSITVRLYADGVEVAEKSVTSADGWSFAFANVPKYNGGKLITYTVSEDNVDGYTTSVNGFDITNTHTPEVITVSGVKTWDDNDDQDGIRPDSITVRLYADGVEVSHVTVRSSDDWRYSFANLPKYKGGKLITHTVSEDNVDGYTTSVNGFNITNTHTPDVITVSGVKTWDDNENQDGIRPDSITVRLYADGVEVAHVAVTSADGWSFAFANMPKYKNGAMISYTITEDSVDGYETVIDSFVITNTHTPDTLTVSGTKTWADNDDRDGIRPDSITVRLYADGVEVAHVAVTSADNWRYSFANLPKYKGGALIVYTVSEDDIEGYTSEVNGFDITNIHTPEVITVSGVKTWDDNENQDGIRPDSITVRLYADGVEVSHVVVRSSDDWSYSFENLPKHSDGKLITYTISEDIVLGYTSEVNGFDITNTHTPVPNDNEPDIENPDTFDRFGVMILTLAASALGIAAVVRKKARC